MKKLQSYPVAAFAVSGGNDEGQSLIIALRFGLFPNSPCQRIKARLSIVCGPWGSRFGSARRFETTSFLSKAME
jgi:hypothetical protein